MGFATGADHPHVLVTLERAAVAPFDDLDPSQGLAQMAGGWSLRATVRPEESFPNAVQFPGKVTVEPVIGSTSVNASALPALSCQV